MKIKLMLFILIMAFSYGDYQQILHNSWVHYKKEKIEVGGRPLADKDKDNVSSSKGQELTYSETVSYILYRAVLINDKKTFDDVWCWAESKLLRKNLDKVFNWAESRWDSVPENKRDYLFAWRFTPNIKKTNMGGIIYVPEEAMSKYANKNGFDVAPDGDQLIAGALIMAHNKWGSRKGVYNYLGYAKNIVNDIWEQCVSVRTSGIIDDFENGSALSKWFVFYDTNGKLQKNIEDAGGSKFLVVDSFNTKWYGIGKYLGNYDLSSAESLCFSTKQNNGTKIIFEDVSGKKKTLELRYAYKEGFSEERLTLPVNDKDGFNWQAVKNLMFQPLEDSFTLDNVRIEYKGAKNGRTYYLFANDRGDPWLNISYYMPFLYESFAKLDPKHPWRDLFKDSLQQINDSKYAVLKNNKGEVFTGIGALVPDWCMVDARNNLKDIPWGKDGSVDGYLHSWDAFRTWYFLGLTYTLYPYEEVEKVIKGKSLEFFTNKLFKEDKLVGGYAIDGTCPDIRGIQYEYPSAYGVYLSYFTAVSQEKAQLKVLDKLDKMYNKKGYWGNDPQDYYKQNWAWIGLEFYENKGGETAKLLKIEDAEVLVNKIN